MADRALLQGAQVDARIPPVSVPKVRRRGALGRNGVDRVAVPRMASSRAIAPARPDRGTETLVACPADLRPLPGRPPDGRTARTEIPGPATTNSLRPEPASAPVQGRAHSRIQVPYLTPTERNFKTHDPGRFAVRVPPAWCI